MLQWAKKLLRMEILMNRFIEHEWVRASIMALVMIGAVLLLVGLAYFIDTTQRLNSNTAYQLQTSGQEINPQTEAEAQGLIVSDIQKRDLLQRRSLSVAFIGGGLVLLTAGWLGRDILTGRHRTAAEAIAKG
jgi:hypothetical protein